MPTAAAGAGGKAERVARAPARATILYDGRCRICRGSVERIRAWDSEGRLDYLSLHEPAVAARFPEIGREDVLDEMHIVWPDGHVERGAEAVRGILRILPGLRWLALAWLLPGFSIVARAGYRWVARNRYRWNEQACDGDVCRMHH